MQQQIIQGMQQHIILRLCSNRSYSGYAATDHSGYAATDQSGYAATDQSGCAATDHSGYAATEHSGYAATYPIQAMQQPIIQDQ